MESEAPKLGTLEIQLETTTTCNADCYFCPYTKMDRAGSLMAMDLFHKIIDEAVTIPAINRYVLTGLSEPLLDPHLDARVRYTRHRTDATIRMYTNGVYLTPKKFEVLKDAGMNSFMISLNAVRPEQHKKIMGLDGKFDIVCSNAEYAIANQGDVDVVVKAVAGERFSGDDAMEFIGRWGSIANGGAAYCMIENNWSGDNDVSWSWDPNELCRYALAQISVMYDGKVKTCCMDSAGKQIFGDLNTQTLREIYNGDKYLSFRLAHNENRAAEYDICKGCSRAP